MLHELDKRLAVIESKVTDTRSDVKEIRRMVDSLRVRVAGVAASVAIAITLLSQIALYYFSN